METQSEQCLPEEGVGSWMGQEYVQGEGDGNGVLLTQWTQLSTSRNCTQELHLILALLTTKFIDLKYNPP